MSSRYDEVDGNSYEEENYGDVVFTDDEESSEDYLTARRREKEEREAKQRAMALKRELNNRMKVTKQLETIPPEVTEKLKWVTAGNQPIQTPIVTFTADTGAVDSGNKWFTGKVTKRSIQKPTEVKSASDVLPIDTSDKWLTPAESAEIADNVGWTDISKKKEKRSDRLRSKPEIMKIDINVVANGRGLNFSKPYTEEHASEPSVETKKGLCRYIADQKSCPFGTRCRYSHDRNQNTNTVSATTTRGQSKKIWMCRHVLSPSGNGCKLGANCVYAHSSEEVKKEVSNCQNQRCNRVVKNNLGKYSNAPNIDNKVCMRLHAGESVDNFIARTTR